MSVLETIRKRGSIRRYQDKPLSESELSLILESARLAQSAANRQPWEFIIVTNPLNKNRLVQASRNQTFIGDAAMVVVCLADPNKSAKVGPFQGFLVDLAIAIENMVLTAWDLGIGSCWIGAFNEIEVKKMLDIPENIRVVSLLTLGYPDQAPNNKHRKPLQDIIHYEKYGN